MVGKGEANKCSNFPGKRAVGDSDNEIFCNQTSVEEIGVGAEN